MLPLDPPPPSRYVVGIDLGTTNSALAFVDTHREPWRCETFAVPQWVAPGECEARETLPSFHFQPPGSEEHTAPRLPWQKQAASYVVGVYAREAGALLPGRLISSAKSWLCHAGVDRTAEILPWQGGADVERLSPVEVSARYLQHLREAWDHAHPTVPLAEQDVVLTLPASFDEVARELTVAAAARAGLAKVVLIEEPQAAFYAWLHKHETTWEQHVAPGDKILVCDIGGGTSDFTLIRVRRGEAERVQFHRVAVGEHLILGGDNLDLALAHYCEAKINVPGTLTPRQFDVLVRQCRQAKEVLLSSNAPEQWTISLPGSGSRLIGDSVHVSTTRDEVRQLLLDGFLPACALSDKPLPRRSGFQEFGLPFAADAAITRYLAAFLTAHRHAGESEPASDSPENDPARPDVVLFNGGMFASACMQQRLLEVLGSWFPGPQGAAWQPRLLENARLDLAVAQGAAWYGMVRRGVGVRITASLARSYYLGLAAEPPQAMCVIPGSAEPGQDYTLSDHPLELVISEPVEFPLFVSSLRLADAPGALLPIDREQLTPLAPLRTVLQTRRKSERGTVPVHVHGRLTEIGTLELWCTSTRDERSWKLQFDVRSATQTDRVSSTTTGEAAGVLDEATWSAAAACLANTFGPAGNDAPTSLMKRLATALAMERQAWPPTLLRRMWETLIELAAGRSRSAEHEARWLNLLGFALRPGYGLALDDWRVAESWRLVSGKLAHPSASSRTESLILWRRLSGGLSAGQQQALAEPLVATVRAWHKRFSSSGTKGGDALSPHEACEVLRLLGSLELLPLALKRELGELLLALLPQRKLLALQAPLLWTLGRLGARSPFYGPLNVVIAMEVVSRWIEELFSRPTIDSEALRFALVQLARRTGDRYRDLPESVRQRVIERLQAEQASPAQLALVTTGGLLDAATAGQVFGEALPLGLRIRS